MKPKSVKEEINKLDERVRLILYLGLLILIITPILATQLDWFFDFSNTGEIGDTIGGLTAPVIGVVSALLIYFSFRAQINANRIIQDQIDDRKIEENKRNLYNQQMEKYKLLKENIDTFEAKKYRIDGSVGVLAKKERYSIYGSEAIYEYLRSELIAYRRDGRREENSKNLSQVRTMISLFNLIIGNIKPIQEEEDSRFFFNLVEILFYRNIWDLNAIMIKEVMDEPKKHNSIIVNFLIRFNEIHIELIKLKDIWPN